MLAASLSVTPFAVMSRPVAGVRNKTLILTLPGSPKGAKENLQAVLKLLPHACQQAAGEDSRSLHSGGVSKLEKDAGVQGTSALSSGEKAALPQHHYHHHHQHDHGHGHGHGGHAGPKAHTLPDDRPVSNDPNAGPSRRYRESPYPMHSVTSALELIAQNTPTPQINTVPVDESLVGAVLAADVTAREAVPAFRASIVDGYAIIASKHVLVPSTKGVFPVTAISHAQAGEREAKELKAGEVARITTGAPLPPGATAVVMVEDTVLKSRTEDGNEEKEIEVLTDAIEPGENVREVGSDVQAGEIIMRKGEGVSAVGGELGLLASVGVQEVQIYKRPVIGVLSTGDEIVPHAHPGDLRLGEVRDTNRPTLLTAIRGSGFEALDLGIASDKYVLLALPSYLPTNRTNQPLTPRPGALESTLRTALQRTDVLITTGGVSMGELDLLKPTLERNLGGTIHFGRVSMKPGKPTTFATVPDTFKNLSTHGSGDRNTQKRDKVVFSLPGNPASAVVTYHVFVLPCLHRYAGLEPVGLPRVQVVLEEAVRCDAKRDEFHRVLVRVGADGMLRATSTGGQRSSRIGSFKGANALLCLPAKEGVMGKGERVQALVMGKLVGMG